MKIFNLSPMGNERAKSFYGKAKIIIKDNGDFVRLNGHKVPLKECIRMEV